MYTGILPKTSYNSKTDYVLKLSWGKHAHLNDKSISTQSLPHTFLSTLTDCIKKYNENKN